MLAMRGFSHICGWYDPRHLTLFRRRIPPDTQIETHMKNRLLIALVSLASAMTTGCFGFEHKSSLTGPSAVGAGALLGSWTSSSIVPSPSSCTDFKWNATEQTNTTARGTFSATCAGDLRLSGTAEGALTTSGTITWAAQGNATGPGLTTCGISLTGSAQLTVDSIRIPYTGNTCLGPVSGTEELRRN